MRCGEVGSLGTVSVGNKVFVGGFVAGEFTVAKLEPPDVTEVAFNMVMAPDSL